MHYRENSIHIWTQTSTDGLLSPQYKVAEKKSEDKPADDNKDVMAKVVGPRVGPRRKSRYWKNFYRDHPELVRGRWDPELWMAFSGIEEDTEEPKRSKFFRKQFRQHPDIYTGTGDYYGSDSNTDSDFDSDLSSDSEDSDSDDDRGPSGPSNRRLSFNRRQAAVARSENSEQARKILKQKYLESFPGSDDFGWNSDSDSDDDDHKHVHWSDEEGRIKPVLKQTKNAQASKVIAKKPESVDVEEVPRQQPAFVEFPNRDQRSRATPSGLNVFVRCEQFSGAGRTVVEVDRRGAAPRKSTPGDSRIFKTIDNHNSPLSRLRSPPSNLNNTLSPPQSHLNPNTHSQLNYYGPDTTNYYIYFRETCSFFPVGQGVLCDFWPTLDLYLPRTMEFPQSRTVLPVEAKVLVVEHVFELPSDPRPNAFYDMGSNTLRVYHGKVYGNSNAMSIPVETETICHANPLIGAGGVFDPFGAPIVPFAVGARPGLLQGPFGPVNPPAPVADAHYASTFYPGTGVYTNSSLPPDLERRKRDAEYAAVLQACRRAEYGRYMDNYIAQGKLRESMNQNQNKNNNHNGGGNSNNWNGNGTSNGGWNQHNNANGSGNGNSHNGGNQNNRNFSTQSTNRNQSQNGNSRNPPQQSGNRNQNQGSRTNSGKRPNNGQNQSRSNSGDQNSNSKSGGGEAWGDDGLENDNSNNNSDQGGQDACWNDSSNDNINNNNNNNNNDSCGDDNNGTSSDPAHAPPSSPTVTVIHHDTSDPFSSEINVRIVVDTDEAIKVTVVNDDAPGIPKETRAYMPCTFPGSPSQNNAYDSGYENSNTAEAVDEWGNVISGDDPNPNPDDNDDSWSNDNDVDEADNWGGSAGEKSPSPPRTFGNNGTELSAGSWTSKNNTSNHTPTPASCKEKKNNNSSSRNVSGNNQKNGNGWRRNQNSNGYNLKQTNGNQNSDTWGDPSAAQSTCSNLSGGW